MYVKKASRQLNVLILIIAPSPGTFMEKKFKTD